MPPRENAIPASDKNTNNPPPIKKIRPAVEKKLGSAERPVTHFSKVRLRYLAILKIAVSYGHSREPCSVGEKEKRERDI